MAKGCSEVIESRGLGKIAPVVQMPVQTPKLNALKGLKNGYGFYLEGTEICLSTGGECLLNGITQ